MTRIDPDVAHTPAWSAASCNSAYFRAKICKSTAGSASSRKAWQSRRPAVRFATRFHARPQFRRTLVARVKMLSAVRRPPRRQWVSIRIALSAAALAAVAESAGAQTLSKGYQILLNRGFQLQGLTTKD